MRPAEKPNTSPMLDPRFASRTIVVFMIIGLPVSWLVHPWWRAWAPGEKGWRVVASVCLDTAIGYLLASALTYAFMRWQQRKKGELKLDDPA